MNQGTLLRLVLLVSCGHALVHVYELALPSVEQEIALEYAPDDAAAGKRLTGLLSTSWRMTWGLGAIAAGWLVDRFGGHRMLAIYLLGCSAMCLAVGAVAPQFLLFAAMVAMGAAASIYHPAGLALISLSADEGERPRVLGLHGIFGSLGIGAAPFAAWMFLAAGFTWRQYYWGLAAPGLALGLVFVWRTWAGADRVQTERRQIVRESASGEIDWTSFSILTTLAMAQGFIYSALLSFLPRYLSGVADVYSRSEAVGAKGLAAAVLVAGCVGQYLAGRFARPGKMELQLTWITLGNVPFLLWMAVAEGWQRAAAAGLFTVVHFMHQPVYNSLVATYTPASRRSLCYGVSFAMGLGLGSIGATFAGLITADFTLYASLAGVAMGGSGLAWSLHVRRRRGAALDIQQ